MSERTQKKNDEQNKLINPKRNNFPGQNKRKKGKNLGWEVQQKKKTDSKKSNKLKK